MIANAKIITMMMPMIGIFFTLAKSVKEAIFAKTPGIKLCRGQYVSVKM
jgi:hypothetical protein